MTDHYIQRRRAARNLLAARRRRTASSTATIAAKSCSYYPPTLPPTPENELYVALAQVQQGSNLTAGIQRLEQAIEKHRPARPDFYYELARAYAKTANHEPPSAGRTRRFDVTPTFVPALKELGGGRRRDRRPDSGRAGAGESCLNSSRKTRRRWPISATYTCANKE